MGRTVNRLAAGFLVCSNRAVERGHRRIDWTADADDAALLRFYDGLGAAAYPKKVFYRLTGDALADLAGR